MIDQSPTRAGDTISLGTHRVLDIDPIEGADGVLSLTAVYRISLLTTEEELFSELDMVRERGYAISREESIHGLWSISMAVKDPLGNVYSALSLSVLDIS